MVYSEQLFRYRLIKSLYPKDFNSGLYCQHTLRTVFALLLYNEFHACAYS